MQFCLDCGLHVFIAVNFDLCLQGRGELGRPFSFSTLGVVSAHRTGYSKRGNRVAGNMLPGVRSFRSKCCQVEGDSDTK